MGVRKIKVLLGFKLSRAEDDADAEKRICVTLKVLGYEPQIIRRSTKKEVQSYLQDNPDCSHVVLMECIGKGTWSQNELAELMDDRDLNMVVVLSQGRASSPEFLMTLYAAGITSAVFEQGRKGASAEEVAGLLVRKRSRKEARSYYHIDLEGIEVRSLTNEAFNALCIRITDPAFGPSYISRLLALADGINPHQMGDFLRKIPDAIRRDLERYAEYGQLIGQLRESGVRVPYRRPRKYRTMNDDVAFLDGARQALLSADLPAEAFLSKESGKKKAGLFHHLAAGHPPLPGNDISETVSPEGVMEVMEKLHFSDEDEGEDTYVLEENMPSPIEHPKETRGEDGKGGGGQDDDLFF